MTERPGGQIRGRESGLRALLLGALALALMACSVPDYVNPVNWFDSKEKKQEIAAAKPAPGKDQPYPKLSSVPDRPDPITIARIRKELTEGLIADSKNARYTDEIIRREPPAPPPRPVQVAKAPASAPVTAKLSTTKPPPPPKLAVAPAASVSTATSQNVSETSAVSSTVAAATAPTATAPAKLNVAAAPASTEASEAKQGSAQPAPVKTATSAPLKAKPTTATAALARPAPPPPPPQLPQLAATTDAQPSGRPAQSAQIATIFFGSATAVLTKDDVSVLREVAALQRETGGTVRVVGHSSRGALALDRVKQGLLNFKLSLDRANAVAEALTRFGVARDRLDVIARGDGELLYAESSAVGAAGNRRAEIFLEFF